MWRREPVLIGLAGLDAVVVACLLAGKATGLLDITGEQIAAISAAVVAVTTLAAAIIRASVVSPATHDAEVHQALHTPAPISWGGDV